MQGVWNVKRDKSIEMWTDRIYCLLFGTCLVYEYISLSTLSDLFPEEFYATFTAVLFEFERLTAIFCIAMICLNAGREKNEIRKVLPSLILFVLILIYLVNNNEDLGLVVLLLLIAASYGRSLKRIYRTFLMTGAVMLTVLFVLSMTGFISNLGGNSFGTSYRTDYAAYLLALMMVLALYYEDSPMPKVLQLVYPLMIWYMIRILATKTAAVCMIALYLGVFWKEYRRRGVQSRRDWVRVLFAVLYLPPAALDRLHGCLVKHRFGRKLHNGLKSLGLWFFTYSFLIYAVVMIAFTSMYYCIPANVLNRLYQTKLATFVVRFLYGNVAFQSYPLTLFGNDIPQRGVGWYQGTYIHFYYILDSSYVRLLMLYGIYVMLLVLGVATAVQIKLKKQRRCLSLFVLSVMALDCTMEQHITQLIYAVPFLMLFAKWDLPDHETGSVQLSGRQTADRIWRCIFILGMIVFLLPAEVGVFNRTFIVGETVSAACYLLCRLPKRIFTKRWVQLVTAILELFLLITGLYSAWHVTKAQSQEPIYDATLVIPGSQLEEDKDPDLLRARIKTGKEYLTRYEDIDCIVSGPEAEVMKRMLQASGIEEDRIYVDPDSLTMEQTLSASDRIIEENELSQRKVLSVLDLQQARMQLIAQNQSDNIRFVTVDCPHLQHFAVLLTEQARYLKLKILQQ